MILNQCLTPKLLPTEPQLMVLTEGQLMLYRNHLLSELQRIADVEFLLYKRKRQLDHDYFRKHPELLPVRLPGSETESRKAKRRTPRPKTKEEKLAVLIAAALAKTGQSLADFIASSSEGKE